ncbi:flagellar hook-associated protein FlgK [Desnuesiella massiliensis]|uniref:flagellar hook-associated protein FlgK n=1 Tax=Desnuesiella massiliensis TaxID=1650662 RepID=UPI0006E30F87|nr:flagellar hook-associated protein FlgK [Desnuesiella massiliensis]
MSGLFGTFNVAKRGMYVQQKSLDVTSHNIANANTEGYSRQRAKIETTRPFGMPSINSVAEPGQLGTGAQIAAIERIRDAFLDYQVRSEISNFSKFGSRYNFLNEVEGIINEPTDTGISNLMTEFYKSWSELSKKTESSSARTVVAEKSQSLTNALNHTYTQLNKLKDNAQQLIKDNVFEINNILNQIDGLNQEIMAVKIAGNMPNDLMDKRDLLLDQLSSKFNIKIDKKKHEGIDLIPESGNNPLTMVRAVENTKDIYRLSYVDNIEKNADGTYNITYYKNGDKQSSANRVVIEKLSLTDDQKKQLEECRVIWTDPKRGGPVYKNGSTVDPVGSLSGGTVTGATTASFMSSLFSPSTGELNGLMTIQEDVNKYINEINKLAKALAWSVNEIHTSGLTGADGDRLFFVNKEDPLDENGINAGNISVNEEIMKNVMKINAKKDANAGESDNLRALSISTLKDVMMMIQDIGITINDRASFISANGIDSSTLMIKNNTNGMKMDTYFKNTVNTLGVQAQEAKKGVKNKQDLLDTFTESRMSVSGVSLDEEMANMVQFMHAYQANAKIIATVDQLLDVVVNGLKK